MEEKRYPDIEDKGVIKACEPMGPFSDEEAIARIEEAERDLADPSKWITIDDLHAELKKLHPWLQ